MIRMSQLLCLLAALPAFATAGCAGHGCTDQGCADGLNVSFSGLDASSSYEIAIAQPLATGYVFTFMTCTLGPTDGGARQLACSSTSEEHREGYDASVQILDNTIKKLQITVSSGGVQIAQQTFDVSYTSKEINGPGCGVCTTAHVAMTIP